MRQIFFIIFLLYTSLSFANEFSFFNINSPLKKENKLIIKTEKEIQLENFCNKTNEYFKKYNWGNSNCSSYNFKHKLTSIQNNPLIYTTIGNINAKERFLIMCGVHGDEITPIKFCFDLLKNIENKLDDIFIIIAPMVSPDSFLTEKPTRTNHNGVDVNRNFPTKNWDKLALKKWKHRYRSDKRRFPGHKSNSEEETKFQIELITDYRPTNIISVHAPLTLLDYDGPSFTHDGKIHSAKLFLKEMSKRADNYRIKDYPVFPGSLGNYAGNELKIPTLTLELPSSDPAKHKEFWNTFKDAFEFVLTRKKKINSKLEKTY